MKTALRHEMDLAGTWMFQVDQDGIGENRKWYSPGHDRKIWRKVNVPGAWDFYAPELRDYEGVAWYAFEIPASAVRKSRFQTLVFNSVGNHAKVWINGRLAAENHDRYLPFEVDLSRYSHPGRKQLLVLQVDNMSKRPVVDRLPGTPGPEWVQYGGILQDVKLISCSRVYVSDFHIDAVPTDNGARVELTATVHNSATRRFAGSVEGCILAGGRTRKARANIVCSGGTRTTLGFSVDCPGAALWTLESPVLHNAEVRLMSSGKKVDSAEDRFGVRTVQAKGRDILLNGKKIRIKGFNRYDELGWDGLGTSVERIRADLLELKKTGANMVRVHYPQHPVHLEIMDEIGLLLMSEVPLNWWRPESRTGKSLTARDRTIIGRAEEALEKMIRRDRNHPCVVAWSMCNECRTSVPAGIRAVKRLLRRARKMDSTRLVTYVTDSRDISVEEAFVEADIVCRNSYHGLFSDKALELSEFKRKVYEPTVESLKKCVACWPDKPLLITEFGTHSLPGFHGTHRFTEEYQAEYLRNVWRAIESNRDVAGGIIWAWADYRHQRDFCPKGFSTTYQAPYGPYGVVSIDREPKAALRTMKQLWSGAGHTRSARSKGTVKSFMKSYEKGIGLRERATRRD